MSRDPRQSWILDSTPWTGFFVSGLGLRILIVSGIPDSTSKHFLDSGIRVPLLWGEMGFERRKLTITTNHRTYNTWYKNNGADGNIDQLFAWRQFSSIRRIFNSITLRLNKVRPTLALLKSYCTWPILLFSFYITFISYFWIGGRLFHLADEWIRL